MNRETIKGRWTVFSWEQVYDDGRIVLPMGTEVEGFIEYSDHGMFCVISKKDRKEFTTGGQWSADDAEKADAYSSYLTYAGGYDVEENTITHHVNYSIFPNWVGSTQYRTADLNGDILTLTTARLEAGTTEARISKLTFKR
ncbi:MAG: lipocalin-like domain-containing protein [Colwellia sp.]|nr:lipocalin-like domain-containing protein [Colwellia sp.]